MNEENDKAASIAHTILKSGINLPPLPAAGAQLLALSQMDLADIDIGKFTKLVETDPGLTAKILQLSNSVYFGSLNKIGSLRQAIVHVGLDEAINSAFWIIYRDTLPQFPALEGFSDKDYWAHSWACGFANKMLGHPKLKSGILPGELYLSGLLHGIGKLILAIHRPEDFLKCLHVAREFRQPLANAQRDILGTTDSYIASEILEFWHFPENICMAVKHYQEPEEADEKYRVHAGLTQFAYFLANTSGVGNINDEFCYDLSETWISKEGSSPLALETTQSAFSKEIYTALQTKAKAIIAVEEVSEENQENTGHKNLSHQPQKHSTLPQKAGFFAWLRSLFH